MRTMSDNDPVTQALCREIHGRTEEQFARIERQFADTADAIKDLSNRLYKDNGTISVQTRLDRQAHEIEELKKQRASARDTQAGVSKEDSFSEFKIGPFAWKIKGKDTTTMFMTLTWRLLALCLITYIVLTVRGVDIGVVKAANVAKQNMRILEEVTGVTINTNDAGRIP